MFLGIFWLGLGTSAGIKHDLRMFLYHPHRRALCTTVTHWHTDLPKLAHARLPQWGDLATMAKSSD